MLRSWSALRLLPGALLLLLETGLVSARAQPTPDSTVGDTTIATATRLESLLDTFGGPKAGATQGAERLARLQEQPLPLNRASAADLSVLPGFSTTVGHRIVAYRREHGPFDKIETLRRIDGVTAHSLRTARPFLTITPHSFAGPIPDFDTILSNLEVSLIQRYTRDLPLSRGFRDGTFLGPPGRLTSRLRLLYKRRVELALTLDKDPGEPFRWTPATDTYGFDHVVGSLTLRDVGPLKTLILGDFSAQFGQGVALWQGLRFGKGRDPISPVLQSGRGVLPYRSASESNYFRGGAATVALSSGLSLTSFVSRRNRDASLDSSLARSPSSGPIPARTISVGGQHRTPSEIADKSTFGETTVGGALEYRSSTVHLGASAYRAWFSRPLRPGEKPYRRFRVSGVRTSTLSVYGTAYLHNYTIFGEVARTANGTYGGLAGAAVEMGDRVQALVLGRHYPPRLATFYGNAFSDGGRPQNETGVYTGLRLRIAEDWTLQGYVDQFRSPWLQYNVPRPTTGWEARLVLTHNPRPWLSTYVQGRIQRKAESTEYAGPGLRRLEGVQAVRRQSVRWHMEYAFSDRLTLRSRIELSRHSTPSQTNEGVLLWQGLRWTPFPRLQLDARLAFFDTDGFAARIYTYEHDLLYSFSVPVLFGQGRRAYVLAEYEPVPSVTFEAKYGVTSYAHRSAVGSGRNQTSGSVRRGIRLQVRWTLE